MRSAIGVGPPNQNVVNNFISGLIMLAERPIRVGDVIQLDDLYGTVCKIGTRSTRIITATNLEIIIPNSSFLENNVINWTLSDDRIRTSVKVEVAYMDRNTRDVSRLLKKAAIEHGLILKAGTDRLVHGFSADNATASSNYTFGFASVRYRKG